MQEAQTIDEVLEKLSMIMETSRETGAADGYFAALYRRVTAEVKERLARGDFENPARMEQLDVVFANRYLNAWVADRKGETASKVWRLAFGVRRDFWPVVLQHLLLGMNAHINLDLGVAAAEAAPGPLIHDIERDFMQINGVLAELVDEVQDRLAAVWPPLRLLDKLGGGLDEAVVNFSMTRARDQAWTLAVALAGAAGREERDTCIAEADAAAVSIGAGVLHPGWRLSLLLKFIRLFERGTMAEKLAALGN